MGQPFKTSLEALETSLEVVAVETSLEALETSLEVAAVEISLEPLETSLEVAAVAAFHNHCPEHYDDLENE